MGTKKCIYCQREFNPKDGRVKYCSDVCRKLQQQKKKAEYAANHPEIALLKEGVDKRQATKLQKRYEAIEWLAKYNDSGIKGGNAMLAHAAGMSYEEWMKIPLMMRIEKREAILERKRYERK